MIYLKNFETTEEYNAYIAGEPVFPNVSLTEDDNKVHYLKSKPLATHFMYNNYYIPEAEYFLEIYNELDSLIDDRYITVNLETGLANGIDISNYPWYEYLTTISYSSSYKKPSELYFDPYGYLSFGNGDEIVINKDESTFGKFRNVPV